MATPDWSGEKLRNFFGEGGQCIDHYLGDTGVSVFVSLGIAPGGLFGTKRIKRDEFK